MTHAASLFYLVLLMTLSWAAAGVGQEVIRSVAELRALAPEKAAKGLLVEMEVVVTYVDREWGLLFVHDGAAGIYVEARELVKKALWLSPGRKVRVKGVAKKGAFVPSMDAASLDDLGMTQMPAPHVLKMPREILLPALDGQWVEVEAVVKRVMQDASGIKFLLQVQGLDVLMTLPAHEGRTPPPMHLLERRVRVRAVVATPFNEQSQMSGRFLYLPELGYVSPLEALKERPEAPLRRVDELLLADSPLDEHVRVRGVVLHAVPGQTVFICGDGGSMRIDSALTPPLKPGAVIEAEGFAVFLPYRPGLNASEIRVLGQEAPPEPRRLVVNPSRRSDEHCDLVTLEADYVESIQSRRLPSQMDFSERNRETVLLCRAEGTVFEARAAPELLAKLRLEPGMRLRLTGVCEIETANAFGFAAFNNSFTLTLRTSDDVVVLHRPPYWNAQRLLVLLGITGGAGLLISMWAWMLRRKVAEQSAIIERQTTMRATLDERQRIARELHDTLEQELSGVAILLDTSSQQIDAGDGEPKRSLELARRLLKHSREESRSTIRDLRSVAIEQLGLVGAMEQMLRPLTESAGLAFAFQVEGTAVRLKAPVEATFLRVAHEAVANAGKHSHGSRVEVKMRFAADSATLKVCDDGTGFSPETARDDSSVHFGLTGMKERAARIGAELKIESREGAGTCVTMIWRHSRLETAESAP